MGQEDHDRALQSYYDQNRGHTRQRIVKAERPEVTFYRYYEPERPPPRQRPSFPPPLQPTSVCYRHQFDAHCRTRERYRQQRRATHLRSAQEHAWDGGLEELVEGMYPLEISGEYYYEIYPSREEAGWKGGLNSWFYNGKVA